jgi:hypothetical protein
MLKFAVRGPEIYPVVSDHVPVNARTLTHLGASTPGFHQKAHLLGGILFIVTKVRNLKQLGSVKLLGPVALVTSFRCGTHAFKRSGKWSGISAKNRRENLWNPGDLGFHVPGNSCTHMAINAGDPCVRAVQVGAVFRFHHCMAHFPAECVGVGEQIGVVAYKGEQNCKQAPSP